MKLRGEKLQFKSLGELVNSSSGSRLSVQFLHLKSLFAKNPVDRPIT